MRGAAPTWTRAGQSTLAVSALERDRRDSAAKAVVGADSPTTTPTRRGRASRGGSAASTPTRRARAAQRINPVGAALAALEALRSAKTVGAREQGCHALVSALESPPFNAAKPGGLRPLSVACVLLQHGAIDVVLACMGRHPRNSWIQRSGLVVLKQALLALACDETLAALTPPEGDAEQPELFAALQQPPEGDELTQIRRGAALFESVLRPDASDDAGDDGAFDSPTTLRVLTPGMKRPGVLDAVSFSMMFHAADYGVQWAGCDVIAAVANVAADLDLRLVRALRARGPVVDVAAAAEKEAEEMMSDDVDSLASSRPPSAIRPQTLHEQVAACVAQVIAIDLDGDGSVAADEVNTIGHALSNGLANHPKYLCLIFAACAAVSAVLTVPRLPALELPVAEEVAQRTGRARASAAAFAPPFGSDDEKCRRYAVPTPLDKMHPLCRAGWAFDIADTRGSLAAAAAAHAGHSGITSACEAAVGLVTAASTVVVPAALNLLDAASNVLGKTAGGSKLAGHAETKRARRAVTHMQSALDDPDALGEGCYTLTALLGTLDDDAAIGMVTAALIKIMLPALLVRISALFIEEEDLQSTLAGLISKLVAISPKKATAALVDADALSALHKVLAQHPDEPTVQHSVGAALQELDDAADLL